MAAVAFVSAFLAGAGLSILAPGPFGSAGGFSAYSRQTLVLGLKLQRRPRSFLIISVPKGVDMDCLSVPIQISAWMVPSRPYQLDQYLKTEWVSAENDQAGAKSTRARPQMINFRLVIFFSF